MPRDNQMGTNFDHGIYIDINGSGSLGMEKLIYGSRFDIGQGGLAAATFPQLLFTSPSPCRIIQALERHTTVAGQACTLQVEKVPSGTAPGSGTNLLNTAFDLTSAANTVVTQNGVAAATSTNLAVGDSIGIKVASGSATSYASGEITILLEWL
jgi:hypothetical protein